MSTVDLHPAARALRATVQGIEDEHLDRETPCEGVSVGQMLHHVVGLSQAFRAAADKEFGPLTDTAPEPEASPTVADGWRSELDDHLDRLLLAWREAAAWEGMTRAGGVDLPGDVAGMVALDEVVLHGWDLARATGQEYVLDDATAAACLAFVQQFDPSGTPGLFGPAVTVPDDAPVLDRLVARAGRDPRWAPR
ncbi:TIGR03086 family metal-binding protein [Aeromicrobium choanae]|uniref:TIGR03086 family protein n=1 Tax=Aeromicrobium choanae TaxID=1736691 RepID=A0A1T4YQG3_9ACTN|nr:TIGR03086 family metal-binding protein [Aeromicrobium choanae]SKB04094.1 TIGR03086 family protein [Aeromicrobium choanae]